MAKGICCAAQAAGDLGKPLVVQFYHHDPTTGARVGNPYQRCGVCEITGSCKNPQKRVFAFRLLHNSACGLAHGKCEPTAAGIAQYDREAHSAASIAQTPIYETPEGRFAVATHPFATTPYTIPQ